MAEPPPKKVGSLKDRIAAFENKGPASSPAPAPIPRPKPGGLAWKPRATSPPPSTSEAEHVEKKGPGMSAADAKESIRGGGSLKERMAALQGRGGFGGTAPPAAPPKPASEKPKWKPPPVVSSPSDEGEESTTPAPATSEATADDEGAGTHHPEETEAAEGEAQEPDPEEEERQRRAAIAARLARLGGARMGMAPPIVGRKPEFKKPSTPKIEEPKEEGERSGPADTTAEHSDIAGAPTIRSPPATSEPIEVPVAEKHDTESSQEYFGGKNSSATSLLSPDSGTSVPRSPAMPVPAAPRRAAPPRRKAPKSPSPGLPAHVTDAEISESPVSGTPQATSSEESKQLQESVHKSMEDEVALGLPPVEGSHHEVEEETHVKEDPSEESVQQHEELDARDEEKVSDSPQYTEEIEVSAEHEMGHPAEVAEQDDVPVEEAFKRESEAVPADGQAPEASPITEEPLAEAEEEDEAARRKRIADRLRQQGGFNPFSAPARKPSVTEGSVDAVTREDSRDVSRSPPVSPAVERRQSARKDSADSTILSPVSGLSKRTSLHHQRNVLFESIHAPHDEVSEEPEGFIEGSDGMYEAEHEEPHVQGEDYDLPEEKPTSARDGEVEQSWAEEDRSTVSEQLEAKSSDQLREGIPVTALTRMDSTVPEAAEELHQTSPVPPPPTRRVSVPPPPRAIPSVPTESSDEEPTPLYPAGSSIPLPPRFAPEDDDGNEPEEDWDEPHVEPVVHPSPGGPPRRPVPPPSAPTGREDLRYRAPSPVEDGPPAVPVRSLPTSAHPARRSIPPPPAPEPIQEDDHASITEDSEQSGEASKYSEIDMDAAQSEADYEPESEHESRALPTRGDSLTQSSSNYEESFDSRDTSPAASLYSDQSDVSEAPLAPALARRQVPPRLDIDNRPELAVFDDTDGDPIDPTFYSLQRSASSLTTTSILPQVPPNTAQVSVPESDGEEHVPPPPPPQEKKEDEEQSRRQTIAERMAKLGGIRFGAPMPPVARRPPPPEPTREGSTPIEETESKDHEEPNEDAQEPEEEAEEDEFARKQRIATRLAGMGGMRFGMFPTPATPNPPPSAAQPESHVEHNDGFEDETPPPPPPPRAPPRQVPPRSAPPPPPPPNDDFEHDSEDQSLSDGVQVEAEESEIEEVSYDDALEEAPPPLPTREGRKGPMTAEPSRPSSIPAGSFRPPVPLGRPPIPPTSPITRPPLPPSVSQNDYVIVEQPEVTEDAPPPPPPRTVSLKRGPPPRSAPPPRPPPQEEPEIPGTHWEHALEFGGDTDLSLSAQWSEDSTQYPSSSQPPQPPTKQAIPNSSTTTVSASPASLVHLTADELMAQWGRVGVQIHEVATTLYEKSKKSLIGDGTYIGFIMTVLGHVPNAALPSPPYSSFGYSIYEQTGPAVQKRASDIMPGDIIVLHDAKLKGHKGIQIYHQTVGAGEPLCAIVGDFEAKKSKVKVFQANQHVGQDSVESASYRLEDLKSGSVKIFRVLEA
ncbi:hypothetical protein EW026_g6021 [Hermanssonia centrifuga]|uniref:BBC1/AIM3 cysteine proteinase-fold domain-containing protein n=1 Tax=Hermanssonia centrifuga TaxID=98765 RepID=A0A4S4KGQ3_9APHY|nr:hypothetical protein EW026_g6021 [Hermanssonia centrifuga]